MRKSRQDYDKRMNKPPKQDKVARKTKGCLENLGGEIGRDYFGTPGEIAGQAAGKLLATITGRGAYQIRRNTLMSNQPAVFKSKHGRIQHREFLADITGSTAFNISAAYPINPGMNQTFPWLAAIAANYEEYELLGLVFEFRSTSGSAISSSSAALGTVIMATDYDVLDAAFVNKAEMESYQYAVSTVPFKNIMHPVECAPRKNVLERLYTRTGAIAPGDLRFHDVGNFFIATSGMQSAYQVGELWVSYDVQLYKPRIDPNNPIGDLNYYSHINEGAAGTATAAHPLGTTGGVLSSRSDLPGVFVSTTAPTTTIILSMPGNYLINAQWYTSAGNIGAAATFSPGTNITHGPRLFGDGASYSNSADDANSALNALTYTVTAFGLTDATNGVVITGLTSMTAADADLFVTQLPLNAN
jgi:hypothetical protein